MNNDIRFDFGGSYPAKQAVFALVTGLFIVSTVVRVYLKILISGFSIWKLYCCNLDGKPTPKKYFAKTEPISFLGLDCQCPGHPEELVRFWYGKDWRTPVAGHNFFYEVKSHYYWRKAMDSLKNLLQMATGWPYWRHLVKKQYKNRQDSLKEWEKYRHS